MKALTGRYILPILSLLALCPNVFSQSDPPPRLCDVSMAYPDSVFLKNERQLKLERENPWLNFRSSDVIPLAFHIVLAEGRDSIRLVDILEQVEVLNECFNGQNADLSDAPAEFRDRISREGPRFCLGSRVDNGEIIPAFELKFTDIADFADQTNPEGKSLIKYHQFGGYDAWDPARYLNVWIGELSLAQGRATFPNTVSPEASGVIIDPDFFGIHPPGSGYEPFHRGKTLVHEIGHFFNLLHVWGREESCDSDDELEDTPLQDRIYLGCPEGPQYSCGSADMYMNFMNFTDDDCLLFFTQGQMQRMLQSLQLFYPGLNQAGSCYLPPASGNPLDAIQYRYIPGEKMLRIELPGTADEAIRLSLFQADGKLVQNKTLFHERYQEFNLNTLPTGIYILFLQSPDNFASHKLLVY